MAKKPLPARIKKIFIHDEDGSPNPFKALRSNPKDKELPPVTRFFLYLLRYYRVFTGNVFPLVHHDNGRHGGIIDWTTLGVLHLPYHWAIHALLRGFDRMQSKVAKLFVAIPMIAFVIAPLALIRNALGAVLSIAFAPIALTYLGIKKLAETIHDKWQARKAAKENEYLALNDEPAQKQPAPDAFPQLTAADEIPFEWKKDPESNRFRVDYAELAKSLKPGEAIIAYKKGAHHLQNCSMRFFRTTLKPEFRFDHYSKVVTPSLPQTDLDVDSVINRRDAVPHITFKHKSPDREVPMFTTYRCLKMSTSKKKPREQLIMNNDSCSFPN